MERLIDLNNCVVDEDEEGFVEDGGSSSTMVSGSSACLELWHACAGPVVSLPKKGDAVVYMPQGHIEQISQVPVLDFYHLPSHVFCRVVDVKLHAELVNDELYAQVSLIADSEIERRFKEKDFQNDDDDEEMEVGKKSMTPHMFCKTLTASDTSTHGGFSVPRRAAEDCFPPLDYQQPRPSQELVAKDLHGVQWKFRHIYRGQPRRHLLTTGWSAFINKKKLVSGDAVLFLRGENGELRLGIRRAPQYKGGIPCSVLCSESLKPSSLTAVAKAVSSNSIFNIYYTPRASPSEFVVPLRKFSRSLDRSFSFGTRFKIQFETEDASERRYTGLIVGISDIDPVRWPGSKWRCLSVRWDDDVEISRHNRVSPWEIEPSFSVSGSSSFLLPGLKRSRSDFPVANDAGVLDFGGSLRFQKVLQGQENSEFNTPGNGVGVLNQPAEPTRCYPSFNSSGMASMGTGLRTATGSFNGSYNRIDSGESVGCHRVLQGQENYRQLPYGRAAAGKCFQFDGSSDTRDVLHRSIPEGRHPSLMQCYNGQMPPTQYLQVSSPSSVLMFQPQGTQVAYSHSTCVDKNQEKRDCDKCDPYDGHDVLVGKPTSGPYYGQYDIIEDARTLAHLSPLKDYKQFDFLHQTPPHPIQTSPLFPKDSSCKLFGFTLREEIHAVNEKETTTVPFTMDMELDAPSSPVGGRSHLKPPNPTKAFMAVT